MKIEHTENSSTIYEVMQEAFAQYKDAPIPSSALEETSCSIAEALQHGERALQLSVEGKVEAVVRYVIRDGALAFSRLSVRPESRRRGYAKALIQQLEVIARQKQLPIITCDVRMHVKENIALYEKLGYTLVAQKEIERYGHPLAVVTMEKTLL